MYINQNGWSFYRITIFYRITKLSTLTVTNVPMASTKQNDYLLMFCVQLIRGHAVKPL